MTSIRSSQSGQMIVEYVLLTVIVVGVALFISTQFRDNELLGEIVEKPWQSLAGMIQNGSWAPPSDSMQLHPNYRGRTTSVRGKELK